MNEDKSGLVECERCHEPMHYMDTLEGMCLTCVIAKLKELKLELSRAKNLTSMIRREISSLREH